VGQTLILISTIIIAAMGAGVLLQTGGGLFSRGDRVSSDVESMSSTKVIMENVILFDDSFDQDVDDIYLSLRLAPGSDQMDLSKAVIRVQAPEFEADLTYASGVGGEDSTHFNCENAAASDGGSGSSGLVSDPEGWFSLDHPIMSPGTIVQVHIDLAAIDSGGALPGDRLEVSIMTGVASPGFIHLTIPDPMVDSFLILK